MKTYTKHNFFKHTYCEFQEVSISLFEENPAHYKSKSDSLYHYTKEGVYRYADHWGRVANCRWKLLANSDYKTQQFHLGFAKWENFCPLNNHDKLFYIQVDYAQQKVSFQHIQLATEKEQPFLFSALEAQKRIGHIRELFATEKWAKYFKQDIGDARVSIIEALITTDKKIQQIKREVLLKGSNNSYKKSSIN